MRKPPFQASIRNKLERQETSIWDCLELIEFIKWDRIKSGKPSLYHPTGLHLSIWADSFSVCLVSSWRCKLWVDNIRDHFALKSNRPSQNAGEKDLKSVPTSINNSQNRHKSTPTVYDHEMDLDMEVQ